MHHSRLCTLVFDCNGDDLTAAAQFWSAALGRPVQSLDENGDGRYAALEPAAGEPLILLQKVDHPSGVHLDIETDDLEAECRRLEALGARRIAWVRQRWWVLQAPSGHRFCVVPRQTRRADTELHRWADPDPA